MNISRLCSGNRFNFLNAWLIGCNVSFKLTGCNIGRGFIHRVSLNIRGSAADVFHPDSEQVGSAITKLRIYWPAVIHLVEVVFGATGYAGSGAYRISVAVGSRLSVRDRKSTRL